MFYIKLHWQNKEGSETKSNYNQSLWKVPVRRWIEYLVEADLFQYFCFPHLYYNCLTSSSPVAVFMITWEELNVLFMCVEWFLYGKISVLCALTCTLAKEVQLSPV